MRITPRIFFTYVNSKILYYLIRKKNIKLGKKVNFKKKPFLDIHNNASLIIGNNVTINSQNRGYHVNMFSKCKIMADRPDAIVEIGDNTRFHGSCIHAYKKIVIGENCLIAANCQIMDGNGHDSSFPNVSNRINTKGTCADVVIEDNVWLSTGVIVLPGVTIGNGSIITANSIVHRDIPSKVIAGGNPIKIIKQYH